MLDQWASPSSVRFYGLGLDSSPMNQPMYLRDWTVWLLAEVRDIEPLKGYIQNLDMTRSMSTELCTLWTGCYLITNNIILVSEHPRRRRFCLLSLDRLNALVVYCYLLWRCGKAARTIWHEGGLQDVAHFEAALFKFLHSVTILQDKTDITPKWKISKEMG